MENWKYIKDFALDLIKFSSSIRDENNITKQRVIILLLDQAIELLMKSFLIKENKMRVNQDKKFYWCLKKIRGLEIKDKEKIKRFHELRSEIQHKAFYLEDINKPEEIIRFLPALENIYNLMFNDNQLPKLIP